MLEEALEHLVTGIVDHKDDVVVRQKNLRRGTVLEVRVHPDDLGRVIGRSGRTATALRTVLGVAQEDTVAVGDGRNDVEMLRWAARGVAMGQAPEEVVEAADETTGHVDDDGLADVLDSLL